MSQGVRHRTALEYTQRAFAIRAVAAAEREPTDEELVDEAFMREARELSLRQVIDEERRRGARGGGRR